MPATPFLQLQHTRTAAFKRPFVLGLLALLVLLKAAVPLLASAAAAMRGVALVEVCTVYGVHTQPLDAAPHLHHHEMAADDDRAERHATEHDMSAMNAHAPGGHPPAVVLEHREHCALSPLLGHAVAAAPSVAPVLLHAPARPLALAVAESVAWHDAGHAWMAQRFHAPPRFA